MQCVLARLTYFGLMSALPSRRGLYPLPCRWGLAQEGHAVYMRMDGMRPACVDTCGSVRHGPREGMLAGGHMYVDEGRWTCPDLVKLKAEKLEGRN